MIQGKGGVEERGRHRDTGEYRLSDVSSNKRERRVGEKEKFTEANYTRKSHKKNLKHSI